MGKGGTSIPHKTSGHTRPRHLNTSAHWYNPYGKREKGTGIPHKTGGHTRPRHLNASAHQYNPYGKREKGTGIPHKTGGHARPKQPAGRDPQPANTSKWILPYIHCVLLTGQWPRYYTHQQRVFHQSIIYQTYMNVILLHGGDHIRRTS